MLAHAKGDRRGNDRWVRGDHEPRRAVGYLCDQPGVDLGGQMRPMLLGRADRHDDDGVTLGDLRKFGSLKARPLDFLHTLLPYPQSINLADASDDEAARKGATAFAPLKATPARKQTTASAAAP